MSRYLKLVREQVARLQRAGADVEIRTGYGLCGLSTRDESRDLSELFRPKEMLIYLLGFELAWEEGERLRVKPEPAMPAPTMDTQPPRRPQ